MRSKSLEISGGFCVLLAMMLLLMPLQWLLAWLTAAAFHELCHYAAIRLCGGDARSLAFYADGAKMEMPTMSRSREVLCALAGPVGGFALLLCAGWLPRVALCGFIQSLYNLMPIYPLDGGRALYSGLLSILPPPKAGLVCSILERVCKWAIWLCGVYGCFVLRIGVFPLLMAALLLIRTK